MNLSKSQNDSTIQQGMVLGIPQECASGTSEGIELNGWWSLHFLGGT